MGIADEKVYIDGAFTSEFLAIMSSNFCGNYGNVTYEISKWFD